MKKVLLIGAGPMAEAYTKVLLDLNVEFHVICRSNESAEKFFSKTGVPCLSGGHEAIIDINANFTHAIVCTPIETLCHISERLLELNIANILIEKPGGLYESELHILAKKAKKRKIQIFIAYNRRFYTSVIKLKELLNNDGGLRSIHFDFTEWSHKIGSAEKDKIVKERWLISNSSHVIDLAFYLAGNPLSLNSITSGSLNWHPSADTFVGSGITENNVLFSYRAGWSSPGRWSLELFSKEVKYTLCPLEELHATPAKSVDKFSIDLDDHLDRNYKPGIFLQTQSFLNNDNGKMCKIEDHLLNFKSFAKIAGYNYTNV